MSNTIGSYFRVTTFGESHGPFMGAVIDGIESNFPIDINAIQTYVDKRKPHNNQHYQSTSLNEFKTARDEKDEIKIVSGLFQGKTTGTPIAILIENTNQNPNDYEGLKDIYRPGHADETYEERYGIRDYYGGGRASGRETVARVAAGAIARQVLKAHKIEINSKILSIGGKKSSFEQTLKNAYDLGESVGGTIECTVTGFPSGIGEPVFDKLDACIAHAVMSIGAVKGIEFGSGFNCENLYGSENNKEENAGGILGGISDGNEIRFRVAVKPTPSIRKPQNMKKKNGQECKMSIEGRHDTCICLRIGPVIEAMTAIILLDQLYAKMHTIGEGSKNLKRY